MLDSEVEQHRRDEELRAARLRMQERFNATADAELARLKELERQRDEERRKQKVEEWERLQQGKGYYSKNRTQTETNDVPTTLGTRLKPSKFVEWSLVQVCALPLSLCVFYTF